MTIWSEAVLSDQEWQHWVIGPYVLWARRVDDELHVVTERLDEDSTVYQASDSPSEEYELRRWILRKNPLTLQLLPVMPDRPVVVRPESPIRFPPDRKARIYVSIPVWLKVVARQHEDITLFEEAIRLLSNIWFGDPMDGVLAYSLKSRARRNLSAITQQVYRALCPVTIHNDSKEELDFQRICIAVDHLNIYGGEAGLWTNEVQVRFRGPNDVSRVDYASHTPAEASSLTLLSEAREHAHKGIFRKSFLQLARLTGFHTGR